MAGLAASPAANLADCAFHHYGLAVKDDAAALKFLSALGYDLPERVYDPLQNVHLRLCTAAGRPSVEIVQPGRDGPSPVDGFITKFDQLIYHTCYETADLAASLAALKALDLRFIMISPPQPAILFGGRRVSFYRIQGVGIVEFLEMA